MAIAAAPDVLLNVRPETAFGREFKKAQAISYWEAGTGTCRSRTICTGLSSAIRR